MNGTEAVEPKQGSCFRSGKKLCKVNPMSISGMKQGLRGQVSDERQEGNQTLQMFLMSEASDIHWEADRHLCAEREQIPWEGSRESILSALIMLPSG